MPGDEKPSVESILKGQHDTAKNREALHRGALQDAYKVGLHEGVLKAAQAAGENVGKFEDLTVDHIRKFHKEGAKRSIQHLEDYVVNYFLDKPGFKADEEITNQLKDNMYQILFGKAAKTDRFGEPQEVAIDNEYFEKIFQSMFKDASGKHLDWGSLEQTLSKEGVHNNIAQKVRYDFGKGIGLDQKDELIDYVGMRDIVDGKQIRNTNELKSLLSYAGLKVSNPDNYDVNRLETNVLQSTPHLATNKLRDKYFTEKNDAA